jgi:signal transduction histidine kinase
VGIGAQAGANHPEALAAVIAGAIAVGLAFHALAVTPSLPRPAALGLLGIQLVITLGIYYLAGCGGAILLVYVLVAELQMVVSLQPALAGTVGLWLITTVPVAAGWNKYHYGAATEFGGTPGFGFVIATSLPGFAFVAAFTHNALGERRQRLIATRLLADLNQAHAQLQLYAEQVEELAAARERNRIAGEIHDTLGHYLTVINIQLETAKKIYDRDPRAAAEAIATAKTQATEALSEVRRSVAALRPAALDIGLAGALGPFIDALRRSSELSIHLDVDDGGRLRPEVEVVAFRVIQEALTNVRKHAAAHNVWVTLSWDSSSLGGSVRDDGRGADLVEDIESVGFVSMRERLGGAGGTLEVDSRPHHGFSVSFQIPAPLLPRSGSSLTPTPAEPARDPERV